MTVTDPAAESADVAAAGADRVMARDNAVLRMSEAEVAAMSLEADAPRDESRMIINMGPSHPSTHGVLRLMLEMEGETVLRSKPVIGYLHTGMEKTGEQLTYLQGATNVTRMDYASPLFNELVFSMAVEELIGIEIPERATWIRTLMSELNRISSHLLFMATNGMDLGAVSMMIYGWREREQVLRFFQKVTGLRMNHNYIRPGGVAADLPDGWRDDVLQLMDMLPHRLEEYDTLMTGQPIWRDRLQGVGVISPEEAIAWAERISDEDGRRRAMRTVATHWYRSDAVAAETWLQQSPLDEEARRQVRSPGAARPEREPRLEEGDEEA